MTHRLFFFLLNADLGEIFSFSQFTLADFQYLLCAKAIVAVFVVNIQTDDITLKEIEINFKHFKLVEMRDAFFSASFTSCFTIFKKTSIKAELPATTKIINLVVRRRFHLRGSKII